MCSQNDQRDVGIILSHVCWGWTPPPPARQVGQPQPKPPSRHGDQGGGGATGLRERGNDTSRSTGRSGRQNAATRRNMRREDWVTVQGPVKEQQPDGMSHRGGGKWASVPSPPPPQSNFPPAHGFGWGMPVTGARNRSPSAQPLPVAGPWSYSDALPYESCVDGAAHVQWAAVGPSRPEYFAVQKLLHPVPPGVRLFIDGLRAEAEGRALEGAEGGGGCPSGSNAQSTTRQVTPPFHRYTCPHVRARTHTQTRAHTHTHTHSYTPIPTRTRTRPRPHARLCTHRHTQAHMLYYGQEAVDQCARGHASPPMRSEHMRIAERVGV